MSESERLSADSQADKDIPTPGDLFFEAGMALAFPLLLALFVDVCFAGSA